MIGKPVNSNFNRNPIFPSKINASGIFNHLNHPFSLLKRVFLPQGKKACKAVGVSPENHSAHKIRFYNARRLYKTIGLTKTSLFLGHSSTAQTLHYIKPEFLDDTDKEAVSKALIPNKAKKAQIIKIA